MAAQKLGDEVKHKADCCIATWLTVRCHSFCMAAHCLLLCSSVPQFFQPRPPSLCYVQISLGLSTTETGGERRRETGGKEQTPGCYFLFSHTGVVHGKDLLIWLFTYRHQQMFMDIRVQKSIPCTEILADTLISPKTFVLLHLKLEVCL